VLTQVSSALRGKSGQVLVSRGSGSWRRASRSPNWLAGSHGFEQERTRVGAVLFDYVLGGHFDRWWVGSGFEYWHSSIGYRSVAGARASSKTPVRTLGGGYIAPLAGTFYVEPWLAGHLALTQASPSIGGQLYRPQRLNGEVSLKLGFLFDL